MIVLSLNNCRMIEHFEQNILNKIQLAFESTP